MLQKVCIFATEMNEGTRVPFFIAIALQRLVGVFVEIDFMRCDTVI